MTLEQVPTLSLIDLSQVEPLSQAVSKLGSSILEAPRKELQQAFRDAHQFSFGLTDLPDLLRHLPNTAAAKDAQAALGRCALANTGSDSQAGGISVQGPASVSVKNYRENGGLDAWADVLHHIQTWPQKFSGRVSQPPFCLRSCLFGPTFRRRYDAAIRRLSTPPTSTMHRPRLAMPGAGLHVDQPRRIYAQP